MLQRILSLINNYRQKRKIISSNSVISPLAKLYSPNTIVHSTLGDYSYIAENGNVSLTEIGKFCSIGPNFMSGYGIHPTHGISTSPMFYSTKKQNGTTLSKTDKIEERKKINIGNDVFIGMNVCVLDGIIIGDGAIIGAGAVVSKDIPPYAIAVGCPIKIIGYRFDEKTIETLLEMKWWNWDLEKLKNVESEFFNITDFIRESENQN